MSDIFKSLSVVGAYEYSGGGHKFCADHFVRLKVRSPFTNTARSMLTILL